MAGRNNLLRFVFLADLLSDFNKKNSMEVAIKFVRATYWKQRQLLRNVNYFC